MNSFLRFKSLPLLLFGFFSLFVVSACGRAKVISVSADTAQFSKKSATGATSATVQLSLAAEVPGSNCENGGFKMMAWTEKGGAPTAYDADVDALISEKYECATSQKKWVEVDPTVLVGGNIKNGVSIAGVTGAYPSAAFKLAGDTVTADLPAFGGTVGGSTYEWFTADGTLISGTVMSDQNVTPSTAAQNFNGGLYRSVSVAGDPNLDAAYILSTKSIFGVGGNVTLPAAANVRSSAFFGAASATRGSIADCGANGTEGCYTTSTYQSANLANLAEGNIKNGVTIAGVLGKYPNATYTLPNSSGADLPSLDATVTAGAYQYFKSDGTRVTGSITDAGIITATGSLQSFTTSLYKGFSVAAANLESHSNCGADGATGCVTTAAFPAADVSDRTVNGQPVSVESYIVKMTGKTLAGKTGSANVGILLASGAHRDQAASQMTYAQELGLDVSVIWQTLTSGVGFGYREVPLITKDDDGFNPDSPMQAGKLVRNRIVALRSDGSGVTTSSTVLNALAGTFTNVAVNDSVGIISSGTGTVTPNFYTVSTKNSDTEITLNTAFVTVNATNVQFFIDRPTSTGNWDAGVARLVCGKSAADVTAKIADCAAKNPSVATWDGATKGIAGEGSWSLVTVYSSAVGDTDGTTCNTTTCYEVWRDKRTGLLWSDKLADGGTTAFNWCHASGANNSSSVDSVYRGADPSGYCALSAGAQGAGANQTDPPRSLCFEDTGFVTSANLDPMKGNMHKHAEASTTVKWRLPTKYDFEVAEHNGIRHVLPNMRTSFWSASVFSGIRFGAWLFSGDTGGVYGNTREYTFGVRCVGGG
jgi:hypothetical protein